tara:strand:+ start:974 stop:1801 length:828 start_codon:yes stop_codon:yes gene_type:complete
MPTKSPNEEPKLMQAIGIDWATEPRKRAAVVVEATQAGEITVLDVTRESLKDLGVCRLVDSAAASVIAVDIPFGWPSSFRSFVSKWQPGDVHCSESVPSSDTFRYRATDLRIRRELGKHPLSVSADRIALGTRKWLELVQGNPHWLRRIDTGDKVPDGPGAPLIEVYPAASILAFGDSIEGYKSDPEVREDLVRRLVGRFKVSFGECSREEGVRRIASEGRDSDKTDAFVAALSGLVYLGLLPSWVIERPQGESAIAARAEGWIFYPVPKPKSGD